MPAALGIEHGQLTFYILTAAFIAGYGFVGFVERAQDFVFFLAIETNVFVDWHMNLDFRAERRP